MKLDVNFILIIFFVVTIMYLTNSLERFTISRPTKCFSCEREFIRNYGIASVWQTMPTKCFDCERNKIREGKNPYHTGPHKCFDCDWNLTFDENQVNKEN